MKNEITEAAITTDILPKPINRHILIKTPITYDEVKGSIIKLSEKDIEEKRQKLFKERFPDFTVKYTVVAVADDCTNDIKPGDVISLSHGGAQRPHQAVCRGDYELISEGDIALIWSHASILHSLDKYSEKENESIVGK